MRIRPFLPFLLLAGAAHGDPAEVRHVVAREKIRCAPLSATFLGESVGEFRYQPEAGMDKVPVLAVAAPGSRVRKGDILLRLDPSDLDRRIAEAETAADRAAEGARISGEELKAQRVLDDAALASAQAQADLADQQLRSFREVQAPLQRREAALATLGAQHTLSDQEQELAQLEMMYRASELAKETKEIVLERARRDVERRRESLEIQRVKETAKLPQELAQQEAQFAAAADQKRAALAAARTGSAAQTARKVQEAEAARVSEKKAREHLAALRRDRERLTITAPADGIVIHGALERSRGALGAVLLSVGDRAEPFAPLLSLMTPEASLAVCNRVPTHRALDFSPGQRISLVLAADPGRSLSGSVREISPLPALTSDDRQQVFHRMTVAVSGPTAGIRPGFEAELRPADPVEALTVPAGAIRRDGNRAQCKVESKDGRIVVREVTLGSIDGDRMQVTSGLEAGETVLVETGGK